MGTKTKTSKAGHMYLYAVIPGDEERELGLKGLYDSTVQIISENGISAVVSQIPATEKLRPERRHLAAHQAIANYLVENHPIVLPVAFGTISENAGGIREMLKKYHKTFHEQIERVSGRVEMDLKVIYEVPNVFEYLVNKYPDLKQERDEIYQSGQEPDKDQKIELGQRFEQVQSQDRELLTDEVEKKIRPPCVELKRNKPRNEKEVMRISCLVEKDKVEEFQEALNEVSSNFDDNFVFEFSGPLPPYNFTEIRVTV